MQDKDVLIIAHRGESYDAPENTLAAINLAWERNADAVEIDIRLSKDGKIVVIHDPNTARVGGNYRKIRNQTLKELKKIDVGTYKGEAWAHETIPTLEEALETIPKGKRLLVEIKCGIEVLLPLKKIFLTKPQFHKQVVFIGLELETIRIIKKELPAYDAYWVCVMEKDKKNDAWIPGVDELVTNAQDTGLDGLDVLACDAVDRPFVQKVHSVGLKLFVWTVNEGEEAKRLCKVGVDGITTDRPMWLRNILKSLL